MGGDRSSRPSPPDSATLNTVGTTKRGNDGNLWEIKENANGVKRWVKTSGSAGAGAKSVANGTRAASMKAMKAAAAKATKEKKMKAGKKSTMKSMKVVNKTKMKAMNAMKAVKKMSVKPTKSSAMKQTATKNTPGELSWEEATPTRASEEEIAQICKRFQNLWIRYMESVESKGLLNSSAHFNAGTFDRKLWGNRENVKIALESNLLSPVWLLQNASERLKDDRELVKMAVDKFHEALQYASERLRDDREIVKLASGKHWRGFQYASERLKDDRGMVKFAVTKGRDGLGLAYASENLKDDEEIVKMAIRKCPYALRYASERLRDDREIVKIALRKQTYCFNYASQRLQDDSEIREMCNYV